MSAEQQAEYCAGGQRPTCIKQQKCSLPIESMQYNSNYRTPRDASQGYGLTIRRMAVVDSCRMAFAGCDRGDSEEDLRPRYRSAKAYACSLILEKGRLYKCLPGLSHE